MCDVASGLRTGATNYAVRDASVGDEEEEKLPTSPIERLQWPENGRGGVLGEGAWPLLLKSGLGSIRGIIRAVRGN